MIIHWDVEQGTDDWHDLRLKKITASRQGDVISKGRGSAPSKTRESYMIELAAEAVTGKSKPFFENAAMKWGTQTEPQACSMYELREGVDVKHCAFIEVNEFYGVSPDGLIGNDGMLEIKAPETTTQIRRFLSGEIEESYKPQRQSQLLAAEREWCDFLSFDPRIDGEASYILHREYRDEAYIKMLDEANKQFIDELQEMIAKLKG